MLPSSKPHKGDADENKTRMLKTMSSGVCCLEFRRPGGGQNEILQEKRPCGIAVIGFGCYYTSLKKIVNQRILSNIQRT